MPYVRPLIPKPKPKVDAPDMVGDLFKRYMKAQKISALKLGEMTGRSESAVYGAFHRKAWNKQTIRDFGKALKIPAEEIGKAVLF